MNCDACDIKNLIYRYADYVDRGDLQSVANLFQRGKIIALDANGAQQELADVDAIASAYSALIRFYEDDDTPQTQHLTSNVMVEVQEDGQSARANSYVVVFQALEDFPLQPIIGVRYFDRFEKVHDQWCFLERRIEPRLSGDLSRHLRQPL